MRILRIDLKNLNSLRGEHTVDLTKEPLASAGLFAITGETGAGKSTLLDAVTLALYGRAARYGKEPNPGDMMSRHTAECRAEVEFEVPKGVFRARWELRRANNDPNGNMQQPKRHVYDDGNTPLAAQVKEADKVIENLIGLDYDRFLRSALLAQGEFSKFLKSNAAERAELLEKLTGTDQYTRLSISAFGEAKKRESDLAEKERIINELEILDDDKLAKLKQQQKAGGKRQTELKKKLDEGTGMVEKINRLKTHREKEQTAETTLEVVKDEQLKLRDDLKRLELHRQTLPFTGQLAKLDAALEAHSSAKENQQIANTNQAEAQGDSRAAQHVYQSALKLAVTREKQNETDAKNAKAQAKKKADDAGQWLKNNQPTKKLSDQIHELSKQVNDLRHERTTARDDWQDWGTEARKASKKAAAGLPESVDDFSADGLTAAIKHYLAELDEEAKTAQAAHLKAAEDLKNSKEHLKDAELLAKYESDRHHLKKGAPCPLCGAVEHPHAHQKVDDKKITKLEIRVSDAHDNCESLRDKNGTLTRAHKSLEGRRKSVLDAFKAPLAAAQKLSPTLKPLGLSLPKAGDEDDFCTTLEKRVKVYQDYLDEQSDATQALKDARQQFTQSGENLKGLKGKLDKLKPLPKGASLDPLEEEDVPDVDDAEDEFQQAEKTLANAQGVFKNSVTEGENQTANLNRIQRPLQAKVAGSSFKTMEALRAARLEDTEAEGIESIEKDLAERKIKATALLREAKKEIKALTMANVLEGTTAMGFKEQHVKLGGEKDKLIEDLANLRNKIDFDDKNRRKRKTELKELETDHKALELWDKLKTLIGSADGKKFRAFAQSITLNILVQHANTHLHHLNPRYSICREDQNPEKLNLQIEDHHQVDARRPMNSLSGGESFLASLALALGLSDLTGRTVAIDTLFIDEGFGSLDSNTLGIAIDSLDRLRQGNKTIGVISHVEQLKERIPTQIVVSKKADGKSAIDLIPHPNVA